MFETAGGRSAALFSGRVLVAERMGKMTVYVELLSKWLAKTRTVIANPG
jgi:hypothetical protein